MPFQVYELQALIVEPPFVVLVLIVRFNVAVFIQPAAFNEVKVYIPLAVYDEPFHIYELQAVFVEPPFVVLALIVKINVAVFTQPTPFNDVNV